MGDSVVFIDAQSSEIKSSLNVDGSVYSIDFAPCGTKIAATFNREEGLTFKEGGVKILKEEEEEDGLLTSNGGGGGGGGGVGWRGS